MNQMDNIKGRVKNAGQGGNTPIPGAVKSNVDMKATRVKKAPVLARKNEPEKKAQSRMGLTMGTRVTSKETRKR